MPQFHIDDMDEFDINDINEIMEIYHEYLDPDLYYTLENPIQIASQRENWEIVSLLLDVGAQVDRWLPHYGNPKLMRYVEMSNRRSNEITVCSPLQAAIGSGDIAMVLFLLKMGADIDARPGDCYMHAALQIAVIMGHVKTTQLLMRKGANIDAPAGKISGRTTLQAAAKHKDTKMLTILCVAGADMNAPAGDDGGRTAIQEAAYYGK